MPRGLGDDPLSRQRKSDNARPVASSAPALNSAGSSYDTPAVQSPSQTEPSSEAPSSPQPSSSYNDVFFQRRFEDDLETVPPMRNVASPPGIVEPVAQAVEVSEIQTLLVATASAIDAESIQPITEKAPAATETQPVPSETLISKEEAKAGQPKDEKRGFFRRIFGR